MDGKLKEVHEHFLAEDCLAELEEDDPEVVALFNNENQKMYCPLSHH